MKSQIKIFILTAALVAAPAHADWKDSVASTWATVKVKVTVKVNEWLGYWKGEQAPPIQVAAPEAQSPSQNATSQSSTSSVPVAPAPTDSKVVSLSAPAVISKEARELRGQPIYTEKAQNSSLQDVQSAREKVKAAPLLKVAHPGREGTSKLAKTKAGVPLANWAQINKMMKGMKKIPQLDIGTESQVSSESFVVADLRWNPQQGADFKKLPQPQEIAESEVRPYMTPAAKAVGPRGLLVGKQAMPKPVTLESVEKIKYSIRDLVEFQEQPYKPLSEDQLKMLAALILFDGGKHCHMIMGLFHQLQPVEKLKNEATYHLGACAADLKMHQAAFDNLSKVIAAEDPDYAMAAMNSLSEDVPLIYERDFYKVVRGLKNPAAVISPEARDRVNYRAAKGAYRAGDHKSSLAYSELVSAKSDFRDDAAFLTAMNKFALGDKVGAHKRLSDLWATLSQSSAKNSNLRALTSVNLARMNFSLKKFDKAHELYLQVPKDHPLWVQALIEQGWTQIALEDYAGAIGNMYSLHSPYFKAVYQPESFVVRTIGYLNICQYGDAYKSLNFIEKDYREWLGKTNAFISSPKGNPKDVYAAVKNYIRGKSTEEVEGVPFQVWREMAHRKDFLNMQTALNDKIDESKRYEGVNEKIKAQKESIRWHAEQSKKRFDLAKSQIAKAKSDPVIMRNIDQIRNSQRLERDLTIAYRFQMAVLEQGRQGYLDFQSKSQGRLDRESGTLQFKTGEILMSHAKDMQQEMSRVLENNEFLRYEVFAGSGENIRYQVAGGEVSGNNRIPAHIRPTKMMNWNFDGEFWEDEIGSYRSSLQNNCPLNRAAAAAKRAAEASKGVAHHAEED